MKKSNAVMLYIAWLVVGLPLGWGVYKTVQKSLPLFTGGPAIIAPAAPSAAK